MTNDPGDRQSPGETKWDAVERLDSFCPEWGKERVISTLERVRKMQRVRKGRKRPNWDEVAHRLIMREVKKDLKQIEQTKSKRP